MKFAKNLLRNQVPEWAASYIDYKSLKKLIKQAQAGDQTVTAFFYALDGYVGTVNQFYNTKFAEYSRRLRYLIDTFEPQAKQLAVDEVDDLVGVLVELRAQLRKLQWYADLNKRGFVKILKKFDKKIGTHTQIRYLQSKILILPFANPQAIQEELNKINHYIQELNGGDAQAALLPGTQRSRTLSASSIESVDDTAELQRTLEADNAELLESLLSTPISRKSIINLLIKAMFSYRQKCIPVLMRQCKDLEDPTEINARNLLHRFIIQYGRSSPANIVGNEFSPVAQNGTMGSTPKGENSRLTDTERALVTVLDSLPVESRSALTACDNQLRTPFHYSCRFGLVEVTRTLLEYMRKWEMLGPEGVIDLPWQDSEGMTPLDLATIHKHSVTIKTILEGGGVPAEAEIDPLLLIAARTNAPSIVKVLLDFGCNIDYQDPKSGETALYLAAKYAHPEILQILIDQGADLEIQESMYGWTPLFVSAVDGSIEITKALIRANANAHGTDYSGWRAKEHAALRGHIALSRLLPFQEYEASPEPEGVPSAVEGSIKRRNGRSDKELIKTVGHRYLQDSKKTMILVTLGSKDLRNAGPPITLDSVPMAQAGQTELDTALSLVVRATNAEGEPLIVDLPISEFENPTEQVTFFAENVSAVQLNFDLVPTYGSSTKVLGRAVALLDNIIKKIGESHYNLNDTITLPILESSTLRVLGTVKFGFLAVTPFNHPNNSIQNSETYWKSLISTRVIGHRGLGKNTINSGSLQLGENTVESFIQAANLGASYVEFDVQLTRDNVPVIYHDFIVSETGLDIPMHHLTLEQFMHLHDHNKPEMASDDTQVVQRKNRSKSVANVQMIDQNDRIRLTNDFRTRGVKGNVRGHSIHSRFATLEELFKTLPPNVGFNIECKYPMLDECEAEDFEGVTIDINKWCDTVLKVVYDLKGTRDIIFSSFNPDVCVLISSKQPNIPVLFLTESGTAPMYDFRASSLQEAIRFATHWNLLGIVSESTPLVDCPRLVQAVKQNGLVCVSYGALNNNPEYARRQLKAGVDAVIVDNVMAVRKGLTSDRESEESGEPIGEPAGEPTGEPADK